MKVKAYVMTAVLALGATATSYAANDMPQTPAHRVMQPSLRINLDRAYAFQQTPPDATDNVTIIPPQTTVPHGPRAANDFIDPALIILKFEEAIRLRSGLRRPRDVQDNEGRIYNWLAGGGG